MLLLKLVVQFLEENLSLATLNLLVTIQ
jgi:hypothetical protein